MNLAASAHLAQTHRFQDGCIEKGFLPFNCLLPNMKTEYRKTAHKIARARRRGQQGASSDFALQIPPPLLFGESLDGVAEHRARHASVMLLQELLFRPEVAVTDLAQHPTDRLVY